MKIAISAGHAKDVPGAVGPEPWGLNEVDEARRVTTQVAINLRSLGHEVVTFADDVSKTQNENLHRIVDWHNAQSRDYDVSVHFNAYVSTDSAMGCEVEYYSQQDAAARISAAIAGASGLINRGARHRTDLFFLNNTDKPALLLEICFVDSKCDADLYRRSFDRICWAIARVGNKGRQPIYTWEGKMSWFGGPEDSGVSPSEGLAFIYAVSDQPDLFLDEQPPGTTGLARRLDPEVPYVALRWDYDKTPRDLLLTRMALVRSAKTGKSMIAYPADWGPHEDTGRIADLSPGLCEQLGLQTDDEVKITFPYG